jgi:DNA modification methylase
MEVDLFGNEIVKDELLRDKFIEPPFSILDTKSGNWQKRKRLWKNIGMKSEVGRDATTFNMDKWNKEKNNNDLPPDVSIFDPALCEVLYHWFCDEGGTILDPFAGGSVRGIVANYLGYKYSGIDIRQEQVDSNREQAMDILPIENQPQWYVGDSNELLNDNWNTKFDMVMSCPPYADLEVYSDLEGDISNKPYKQFLELYESIIAKSCKLLKVGGYACFVVGEVRDKNGFYIGFVPDTIKAFEKCGMKFYNEAILLNAIASASMRANGNMKSKKLVKVHQNILVFKKI